MKEFVPFVGSIVDRGIDPVSTALPTKDQLFENCLFYKTKNPFTGKETTFVERRPGIPTTASNISISSYLLATGLYFWKALGTVCKYGYSGALVHQITITDTGGDNLLSAVANNFITGIIEVKNSSGVNSLLVTTTNASLLTSCGLFADGDAAFTAVTLPSGAVGSLVHMNGYTFVASTDGRIYNSPLNNPAGSYTDFIGADFESDSLRTLAKVGDGLVAFGTHSFEIYRIGEQTTGSPLQRIPEASQKIGVYFPLGTMRRPCLTEGDNTLWWVGTNENNLGLYTMTGGKPEKISGAFEDKLLLAAGTGTLIKYLEIGNKKLVMVYLDEFWLVYDIDDKIWNIWSSGYAHTAFDVWYNTHNTRQLIILDKVNPVYWIWSPGDTVPYKDVTVDITRKIRTSPVDFDTNSYKDFPSLAVIGDKATTTSNISIRWTKDDYQNWSTTKNIDMSSANPGVKALGVARRIAFEFSDTVERAQRVRGFELEYNIRD